MKTKPRPALLAVSGLAIVMTTLLFVNTSFSSTAGGMGNVQYLDLERPLVNLDDTLPPKKEKSKEKVKITQKGNGKDVKMEMEDGEITKLKVDGKKISPEDYDQYLEEINEAKGILKKAPVPPEIPPLPNLSEVPEFDSKSLNIPPVPPIPPIPPIPQFNGGFPAVPPVVPVPPLPLNIEVDESWEKFYENVEGMESNMNAFARNMKHFEKNMQRFGKEMELWAEEYAKQLEQYYEEQEKNESEEGDK